MSLRRQSRDLRLLRGELVKRVHGPFAGMLARRLQLHPRALGERLHPELGEEVVGVPQLRACVQAPELAPQPLAVEQMRPREVEAKACRFQTVDGLTVQRLGGFPATEERPRARFDTQCPWGAAGARTFAQALKGFRGTLASTAAAGGFDQLDRRKGREPQLMRVRG